MASIVFSLLVHERPLVVLDQIKNILSFNPNSTIVIHFNPRFSDNDSLTKEELINILQKEKRVVINPHPVEVSIDNLIQGHLSNYHCVEDMNFNYFYLIASNELFICSGAEKFVEEYDYGCEKLKNKKWFYYKKMMADESMKLLLGDSFEDSCFTSQVEGSFYSKEIFAHLVASIEKVFDYKNQSQIYPREESMLSTIACNDYPTAKRYDGCLCYINWKRGLFISIKKIKKAIASKSYFSIKRVDRKADNYLREYIRDFLCKNNDVLKDATLPKRRHSLLSIHVTDLYWTFHFFVRSFFSCIKHKLLKQ